MDGQEYLNQISASNRPVKQSKASGILSSKFFLVGGIGLVVLILIIIIGSILGGGKGGEKNNSFRLMLHITNTNKIVEAYQPEIKSSSLRASSASLKIVLADTESKLNNYLVEKYKFKEKNVDKDIMEQATTAKDGLEAELFEAKINGVLDRVFAHKMAYEISTLMAEESKVLKATKNSTLTEMLKQSYDSLENLYDKFNDFSEAK